MSMFFYEGQNAIEVTLNGLGPLSDVSSAKIKYEKPDGTSGQWNATVTDAITGIITYVFTTSDSLIEGTWKVWAHITFNDGRKGIGDAVTFQVMPEGYVPQ